MFGVLSFSVFLAFNAGWVIAQDIPQLAIYQNTTYGSDPQQIMDIYLPAGRDPSVSKVVLLIHGGGWSGGNKESMNGYVTWFYTNFPRHAIVNMNYRLATINSPGFPKQIQDIQAVIAFIKSKQAEYKIQPSFGLVGASAGAHLSMLYGYGIDYSKDVKVIGNIVGPADLTDPNYRNNSAFNSIAMALVGNTTYEQNPVGFLIVSPTAYVSSSSPKTISFYGGQDPLIPNSQGSILEEKLDAAGVYNKFYLYPNEGHGFTNMDNIYHCLNKLKHFFQNYL